MSDLTKEEKREVIEGAMVEVYRTTDAQIGKSRVMQCQFGEHKWHKLSDNEVACGLCPTVLIIDPEKMGEFVN